MTYFVTTPRGFTETFDQRTVETLVALGLIEHEKDFVSETGVVTHFYRKASA